MPKLKAQHGGSGRQAFERGRGVEHAGGLDHQQLFAKLGNLPLRLSETLLAGRNSASWRRSCPKPAVRSFSAPCIAGRATEVFGIDGKAIKHVEERLLKPLPWPSGRHSRCAGIGRVEPATPAWRWACSGTSTGRLEKERLLRGTSCRRWRGSRRQAAWIVVLDRLYCNLGFPALGSLGAGGRASSATLQHPFVADPTRPAQKSRDVQGQRIVQEWGRLGKSAGSRALYVRRITLRLAGGALISVVTDLLDEAVYPAEALLVTYRKRWGIRRRVFHQMRCVFAQEPDRHVAQGGALFQLSFCLLLYNTLQVLRTHLAFHQECNAEATTNKKLFYDLKRELVAVDEAGRERMSAEVARRSTDEGDEFRSYLQENLRGVWSNRWWKAPSSRRRWAQEGEDSGAWQSYVDLQGAPASKNMNRTVPLYPLPDPDSTALLRGGKEKSPGPARVNGRRPRRRGDENSPEAAPHVPALEPSAERSRHSLSPPSEGGARGGEPQRKPTPSSSQQTPSPPSEGGARGGEPQRKPTPSPSQHATEEAPAAPRKTTHPRRFSP